jgi:hypothetical protein
MDTAESKIIKILHLYHDLMSLYGDWANAAVLGRELVSRGCVAEIDKKSVGDSIDFEGYSFICIGSGTERSQQACMRDMVRFKDAIIERIEADVPVLVTGNAHELFGQAVMDSKGNRMEALGLLEFETIQTDSRLTGDCVSKASFLQDKLMGFINRAGGGQQGEIKRPFFVEPGAGAHYKAGAEGIMYRNLLGTYLTGPVLVRNPPLLRYFADMLVNSELRVQNLESPGVDPFFAYQEAAYRTALSELSTRI